MRIALFCKIWRYLKLVLQVVRVFQAEAAYVITGRKQLLYNISLFDVFKPDL